MAYFSNVALRRIDRLKWVGICRTIYWEQYEPLELKRGTILVDPNVFFQRNVGSLNNTIVHECVHWHLHEKYHEFHKLYDDSDIGAKL
jgi:hypothetical protein